MSVLIQTTLGPITLDLNVTSCPLFCRSFLSLCAHNYYDKHLVFNVVQNRFLQTGDPTGTGEGGESAWGKVKGEKER